MNVILQIPDVTEPLGLFRRWYDEAVAAEPDVPEAMTLATATPDGRPSLRVVLLKEFGDPGFVFYTNASSRKGREIAANPHAAICLHWKTLGRQVRAEGPLHEVTVREADAYWASRPRPSQVAAWASDQSDVLASRGLLRDRVSDAEARFKDRPVPRPLHWKGFRLAAQTIEFWLNLPNRLHERLVFHRTADGWRTERLYP